MNPRALIPVLGITFGLTTIHADASTLAAKSPFIPLGTKNALSSETGTPPLELRGVMTGPLGSRYYIYSPAQKHGVWAGPHELENLFEIVSDDPVEGSLKVRMADGSIVDLEFREAKSLGSILSDASSGEAVPNNGSAGTNNRSLRPQSEGEKRWDQFREEVTRRQIADTLKAEAQ